MVKKYIIMCGGRYEIWEIPRHLSKICGEEIVARTIRLLKENGITDISISSNNPIFEKFGLPVLKHENSYVSHNFGDVEGNWYDAFYPMEESVCYLFGDVVFSPEAIKTIIETETDDIEFFGSRSPFTDNYIKNHEEPFALKVVNQKHLHEAIEKTKELDKEGKFWRKPLMWELWTVIKETPLQTTPGEYPAEYVVINDYTCDVDRKSDISKIERMIGGENGKMFKVEVIEPFTLERFKELKNIVRKGVDTPGQLNVGDIFDCTEEMADYLMKSNSKNRAFVKIIEVIPAKEKEEVKEEPKEEKLKAKKTTKKKTSKK